MHETPKGLRLHIGLFGRRNAGKSSLLNALVGQAASIVSATPGTTTDPVEKTMELAPLGPVVFIDTAGIDEPAEAGELGAQRMARTMAALERTDVAVLVTDGVWGEFEDQLFQCCTERKTPCFVACTKADLAQPTPAVARALEQQGLEWVAVSAVTGEGLTACKTLLAAKTPEERIATPRLLGDLLPAGRGAGLAVLVVPIDLGAPKGRLILPQVQAIRDVLDADGMTLIVKERELREALSRLRDRPDLVVCDSQVVLKTVADTPPAIPMTTFSICMARLKGDLDTLAAGAGAISRLRPGDRVLIAEACTHHALADDIGRVKIPRWLRQHVGGDLTFDVAAGRDFPADLAAYALVVHCGGCMINRALMCARVRLAQQAGVPITNYGMAISVSQGVLFRTLQPFPGAMLAYEEALSDPATQRRCRVNAV